jgi:hypothetical protein
MKGLVTLIVKVFTCIQEAAKRGTWEPVGNISRMRIWESRFAWLITGITKPQ